MHISNLIKRSLFVWAIAVSAYISGAASSVVSCEGRRVDSFSADTREVSPEIGALQIAYLPNSALDRLRVFAPEYGTPVSGVSSIIMTGRFEHIASTEPIALTPIKSVSIAQILQANPFRESSLPTARKWLMRCVNDAGIVDVALDQREQTDSSSSDMTASEASFKIKDHSAVLALLVASTRNTQNAERVCEHLPEAAPYHRQKLAELFGELRPYSQRIAPLSIGESRESNQSLTDVFLLTCNLQ